MEAVLPNTDAAPTQYLKLRLSAAFLSALLPPLSVESSGRFRNGNDLMLDPIVSKPRWYLVGSSLGTESFLWQAKESLVLFSFRMISDTRIECRNARS